MIPTESGPDFSEPSLSRRDQNVEADDEQNEMYCKRHLMKRILETKRILKNPGFTKHCYPILDCRFEDMY